MERVAAGKASGVKLFCQNIMICCDDKSIPDRSRPGLPTTASGIARQGTCGNYDTAVLSENKRKRGGRRVKRQWEMLKGRQTLIRVGT